MSAPSHRRLASSLKGTQLHAKATLGDRSLADFSQQIASEFITGSAIDPALFQAAILPVSDTEIFPGGEVSYPIHEALNWHLTRFGRQARETSYAALLLNEGGSTWQAKLGAPRIDAKGKVQKYETPVGNGSRAYLPSIPPVIRQRLADHYGLHIPLKGSFWDWLEQHPDIPFVLTEGGKKGLAGFSQGFVTLALYGCHGGYRTKNALGQTIPPTLIPDLARFATPGRQIILAFDEDANEQTRRQVVIAQSRLGALLKAQGCDVSVACWDSRQGKGLDDLIVNAGADAWAAAYANALPFSQWQIWQRLEQRLTLPAKLTVRLPDLAKLEPNQLPSEGLVAVRSPKGTGKTKLMATLVAAHKCVLSLTHRISLGRNLCTRTGLTYRGDLDKVKGQYFNESGYTLRIGSCVDGLLSLDPAQFIGCTLILDEGVALVRHLLTSATCARDGKRPALLARFRSLVREAKLVLLADADLDNATLQYIQELRGEEASTFLVRNDFAPQAYPCVFLQAPDLSAITGDLLAEAAVLPAGKVLYVATDSKTRSKALHRLLTQQYPDKRVLVLNSETTGGDCEREFMQTPDLVLERGDYDIVICSPSVASGVSLECQGIIAKVYGIFTGVSATDADLSQSLSRVRAPVERKVWCAKVGSNYSPVSRSGHPFCVRSHLQSQTIATIQLIRANLKEDTARGMDTFNWKTDPHIKLYCALEAERNRSMYCLREALLTRLQFEGNTVTVEERSSDQTLKLLLAQSKADIQCLEAETLVAAHPLTYREVLALELKETLLPAEHAALAAFRLKDFYQLETLTVEAVLDDQGGRRRAEILSLEALLDRHLGIDHSARSLEKQAAWHQGITPWDISLAPLRRELRVAIGLDTLLTKMRTGWRYGKDDLKPYADRARELKAQIKVALHFTITDAISDVQIIHQLLSQMGIRTERSTTTRLPGYEGQKVHCYHLNLEALGQTEVILERRQAQRERLAALAVEKATSSHPTSDYALNGGGGYSEDSEDSEDPDEWLSAASLENVQNLFEVADNDPEVLANLWQTIPHYVLEHLGKVA